MAPTRTPPNQSKKVEILTTQFNAEYVSWQRLLQRANGMRIKVLLALETNGSRLASDLLGEKPRYAQATRCQECAGCAVMCNENACQRCRGCLAKDGCNEYTQLCFSWDRVACNYFTGSVVTSESSQFDLATVDLSKYRALIEEIKTAAINIDLAVDEFPPGHPHKDNPRYKRERLDKDVENEESHLIEEVLGEHFDLQLRLSEVLDEVVDPEGGRGLEDVASSNPHCYCNSQATSGHISTCTIDRTFLQQRSDNGPDCHWTLRPTQRG